MIVAIGLALASAVLHALWNFLVKRSGASGAAFTWWFTLPSVLLLTPYAAWTIATGRIPWNTTFALLLAGSAIVHTGYLLILVRGYARGHLSIVYPLARGSGPLLAGIIAVALFRERPGWMAVSGGLCVILGAAMLAFEQAHSDAAINRARAASIRYGLLIGAFIGVYTAWDKYLVGQLQLPPAFLEWSLCVAVLLIVTPSAFRDRAALMSAWREHKTVAVSGAILGSTSYILFLTALAKAPVTRIAPLREVSILIGAALGSHFLGEGHLGRRLIAAASIASGVVLLSLG
jgi:drug/metabolite transporter (DMT)-like permease